MLRNLGNAESGAHHSVLRRPEGDKAKASKVEAVCPYCETLATLDLASSGLRS